MPVRRKNYSVVTSDDHERSNIIKYSETNRVAPHLTTHRFLDSPLQNSRLERAMNSGQGTGGR